MASTPGTVPSTLHTLYLPTFNTLTRWLLSLPLHIEEAKHLDLKPDCQWQGWHSELEALAPEHPSA